MVARSAGVAGRHAAGLVFRVGQFDEALPDRGITHMAEHLTLGGHHEATYHFNASVAGRAPLADYMAVRNALFLAPLPQPKSKVNKFISCSKSL